MITVFIAFDGGGYFLLILIAIISFAVQWRFRSKFKQYSEIAISSGKSGKEIAELMLKEHDIHEVQVLSVEGQLTDHYNPADRTINLSPEVYHGRSVSAAAVAAHECGHAVQHAKAYQWLSLRSAMVPLVDVASTLIQWTLFIGIMLLFATGTSFILAVGVAALALITAFSFITLPIEFDASKRAFAWLNNNHNVMQTDEEYSQAKDALWWASMTYVVAAVSSLAALAHYASILFHRRDD